MRRISIPSLLLCLLLAACGDDSGEGISFPESKYSPGHLLGYESLMGLSFSHDETKILYSGDRAGRYNLYAASLIEDTTYSLTGSQAENIIALSYFPEDDRMLFLANDQSASVPHIMLLDEIANTHDLTPYPGSTSRYLGWSWDHKSFYFICNKRDQKIFDLYRLFIEDMSTELVFENNDGYEINTISNNNRYLAVSKRYSLNSSEVFWLDLASGRSTRIAGDSTGDSWQAATFSPDSKDLYLLTNSGTDRMRLVKYALASGKMEDVAGNEAEDVAYGYFSVDGKHIVIGYESINGIRIEVLNYPSMEKVEIPELPQGEVTMIRFSRSGKYMAFYVGTATSPANLYFLDMETNELQQLTSSMPAGVLEEDLIKPTIEWTDAKDGEKIPAYHYKPLDSVRTGHGLIWVHDGPPGRAALRYEPFIQMMALNGFDVWDVNYRGSTGMGKRYLKLDDKKHGIADISDCADFAKLVKQKGEVNAVAIAGIGYGGFMTLVGLISHPDAFDAGVNMFGDLNWITTLNSIPPQMEIIKQSLYAEFGDPEKDADLLRSISPIYHGDRVADPLMVIQGALDRRVMQADADEFVNKARSSGNVVEYKVMENTAHGFHAKQLQASAYEDIVKFLNTNMRSGSQNPE